MRLFVSLAIVFAAQPSVADPLGLNDYDRIFQKNASSVEVSDNGDLVLKLDGNVALMRQETGVVGTVTAVDFNKTGSVGCAATLYASIEAIAKTCEGTFDQNQLKKLSEFKGELLDFYADNTYPVSSRESVQVAYDAYVQGLRPISPGFCEAFGGDRKVFFNYMTSDQMRPDFDALLSEPRLPVSNPCL